MTEETNNKNSANLAENNQALSAFKSVFEYVETFCYALVITMLLLIFIFRYVTVDGESMRETLQDKDKLVISNIGYTPETGDIVVIKFSPIPLIKRVIATEGQTVKIDYANWAVYVDGKKLDEPYVFNCNGRPSMDSYSGKAVDEFVVDEGMVYVMGDNRNNSWDSRKFGQFSEKDILGRVIFRVFPISEFGDVDK